MPQSPDAWSFGIDLILSTHDPLVLPQTPQSVPRDIGAYIRTSYLCGRTVAGQIDVPSLGRPCDLSAEQHLLTGAYLVGIATRSLGASGLANKDSATIGCVASKHLVFAVLQIEATMRRHIYWQTTGTGFNPLQIAMAGSYSEAHVASVLLEAGQTVLASTTEEDVDLGIDLLVPFNDSARGMALQVKTASGQRGVALRRLDATDADPTDARAEFHAKIVEKVGTFNRNLGVAYEPVIGYAGIEEPSRFHFDHAANEPYVRAFIDALGS